MITGTHTSRRLTLASGTFAGLLILAGASAAGAQDASNGSDARWQAYIGCWAPSDSQAQAGVARDGAQTPLVCVVPANAPSAVDIITLVDGNVTTRQRIEATGAQRQATRDGCTGWESAQWSPGGERVYLRSEFSCDGGVKRASNGVLSITPSGEWLDVQGVTVGSNKGVRVVRYREVPSPSKVPAEVQTALAARTHANTLMRTAAAVDLGTDDVVEATKVLDPIVVETWLVERGQGFGIDAKKLVELSKAGVPGSVTDVMVALSYPQQFAINLAMRGGEMRTVQSGAGDEAQVAGNYNGPHMMWDPFWASTSRYGYYGYGYSPYGYFPGYGWYGGNRPVVVVVRPPSGDVEERQHGRVVNGRGYTQRRRGSSDDDPSPRRTSTSDGSSSTGAARSGESGSSGGSKSGGSTGRTAKPRSP